MPCNEFFGSLFWVPVAAVLVVTVGETCELDELPACVGGIGGFSTAVCPGPVPPAPPSTRTGIGAAGCGGGNGGFETSKLGAGVPVTGPAAWLPAVAGPGFSPAGKFSGNGGLLFPAGGIVGAASGGFDGGDSEDWLTVLFSEDATATF